MKKFILLICIVFPMFVNGQKTAYLYSDSVLLSIPRYGIQATKLDSLKQSYSKEIDAKQTTLQQEYEKLVKPYAPKENETLPMLKKRMNAIDTLSLSALVDESALIQKKKVSYDRLLQTSYAQEIQPILDRVSAVIREYAVQNNLSAIYSMEQLRATLVYIDPKQNITSIIIGRLKKREHTGG